MKLGSKFKSFFTIKQKITEQDWIKLSKSSRTGYRSEVQNLPLKWKISPIKKFTLKKINIRLRWYMLKKEQFRLQKNCEHYIKNVTIQYRLVQVVFLSVFDIGELKQLSQEKLVFKVDIVHFFKKQLRFILRMTKIFIEWILDKRIS